MTGSTPNCLQIWWLTVFNVLNLEAENSSSRFKKGRRWFWAAQALRDSTTFCKIQVFGALITSHHRRPFCHDFTDGVAFWIPVNQVKISSSSSYFVPRPIYQLISFNWKIITLYTNEFGINVGKWKSEETMHAILLKVTKNIISKVF